uniref:NAC1 transcription factor n=1 Tax=Medicago sativa TaxID=3879 RepID=A0A4Y5ULR4_MEDSA|nr:NAC1 transcription factor [Medicago sativa]
MVDNNTNNNVNLPPGFRFYPTDEELVVHFLHRKASLLPCHPDVIPDLDLYPFDPWQLQGRALEEGNQWYYYSRRTQNRMTNSGYWMPMGMEEQVVTSSSNKRVGMKKYYVFHIGEAPNGNQTNWIMQEYRLSDSASSSSRSSSKRKSQPKSVSIFLIYYLVHEIFYVK